MFPEKINENILNEWKELNEWKDFMRKLYKKTKEEIEQRNKPWKVNYLRETKDYKIYSYTVDTWGTKKWIKGKYINQVWPWNEKTQFTDAKWDPIKKDYFNAWEVVYLRVPKKKDVETIDSTPEMSKKEIDNLNWTELMNIFKQTNKDSKRDNIWEYIIVQHKGKNRKLYFTLGKDLKDGHAYITFDSFDGDNNISIWIKKWNKITWIYSDLEGNSFKKIYRWELIYKKGSFEPKKIIK